MIRTMFAVCALALLASCTPPPKDVVLTGELSYDNPIELPANAKTHIDLTYPQFDQPTLKLASVDVAQTSTPIPFTLTIPGKDMPKAGTFMFNGYVSNGDRSFYGTGNVELLHSDLAKPLKIKMLYVPPTATMYKCAGKWYEVTLDLAVALVRPENMPLPDKVPLIPPAAGDTKTTYQNSAFTVVKDGKTVSLGVGKGLPEACITGQQ